MSKCPTCNGEGTIPVKCPRCFGSGIETPTHTANYLYFTDGFTLVSLDNTKSFIVLSPGEQFFFWNVYIDKINKRRMNCTSKWYLKRWGNK